MILGKNSFFRNKHYRHLVTGAVLVLAIGTAFYHFVEKWTWLDSIYFSVITLTTVGYGDLSPKTNVGKVFTMFYVLIGIGIIFGFINTMYEYRVENRKNSAIKKNDSEEEANSSSPSKL